MLDEDAGVGLQHPNDAVDPVCGRPVMCQSHQPEKLVEHGGMKFGRIADVDVERSGAGVEFGC